MFVSQAAGGESLHGMGGQTYPSVPSYPAHRAAPHTWPCAHYHSAFFPRRTSSWHLMTWSRPQMILWPLWTKPPISPW